LTVWTSAQTIARNVHRVRPKNTTTSASVAGLSIDQLSRATQIIAVVVAAAAKAST
jgi:hypothetical protein